MAGGHGEWPRARAGLTFCFVNKRIDAVGRAVTAGLKAASEASNSKRFHAGGKAVVCTQCGGDKFRRYGVMGSSFGGYGLECAHCSHIEYFGRRPKEAKGGA